MIDFKVLKESISIDTLLATYGIELRPLGEHTLIGPCPIHRGNNPTAFRVHRHRGVWHCFTRCGGGNVLDLVARMEGLTIYQAGLRIQSLAGSSATGPLSICPREAAPAVNPPLKFQLQLTKHPYLEDRGLNSTTCNHFGVGYCSRGIMAGKIGIPIHDHQGHLVAYAGRSVETTPAVKYCFPSAFRKSALVYNACRVPSDSPSITVVEGFFDVFHLHQKGYPATVALMGSTASLDQIAWLRASGKRLDLLLDGDAAGRRGSHALALRLQEHSHPFREITLPQEVEPEHLSPNELAALLGATSLLFEPVYSR